MEAVAGTYLINGFGVAALFASLFLVCPILVLQQNGNHGPFSLADLPNPMQFRRKSHQ
jgi:hypothetical protein